MRDLPQMQKIYARARALMAANGNPTQWGNEFPRESMIEDDIANQRTMLLVDTCNGHERILAQFALCPGEDPTYAKIDGAWLDNDAYVTIHRIAASGLVRHAARDCIRWALKHYGNVRADTHPTEEVAKALKESLEFIAYKATWDDVPATTEKSCGNYRDHSLFTAKEWAKQILEEGISSDPFERKVV